MASCVCEIVKFVGSLQEILQNFELQPKYIRVRGVRSKTGPQNPKKNWLYKGRIRFFRFTAVRTSPTGLFSS